ncbi:MAG: Outer membrane protein [Rhodospirillaceae bacterium]|nr:MAG: Outer membrane protein [Rhodospirillaceae bacterium]
MLERVATHASTIVSRLRRFQTYALVEQAFAKIQAALRHDLLPKDVTVADIDSLSAIIATRFRNWGEAPAVP